MLAKINSGLSADALLWLNTYVPTLGEVAPEGLCPDTTEADAVSELTRRGEWPLRNQSEEAMWTDYTVLRVFFDHPIHEVFRYANP